MLDSNGTAADLANVGSVGTKGTGIVGEADKAGLTQQTQPTGRYDHKTLPEHLQRALKELREQYEAQADYSRREYVKKCLKNHEFFRGNQWGWWDYTTGTWRTYQAGSGGIANTGGQMNSQSLYAVNIFQGFCLSIVSLLSGSKMTQKFWPRNSNKVEDVRAAKRYDKIVRHFQQNERSHAQLLKAIYYLFCDGTFGSYIRTKVDPEQFGTMQEPDVQMVEGPIGSPRYACVICQQQWDSPGFCQDPTCGAPLPQEPNVPPPVAPQPQVVGYREVPRAKTVRDVVGGLELKLPPTAEEQSDYLYLIRSRELAKASVRATFPELSERIGQSGIDPNGVGTPTVEKRARLQAASGTTTDNRAVPVKQSEYVTFTETWFRKSSFYQLDDAGIREELVKLFPTGCYVAHADDVFCEARDESMDDHWRICHALPGRGQLREPIGAALVQIQELANDILNIIRDIIEYTIPPIFADQQVLDVRKWARSQVKAGAVYNVTPKGSRPIGEGFYQPNSAPLPEFATQFLEQLRTTWAQFATGSFPASYGGGSPGNNTAAGIEMERNAALGRIALYLRALTEHYAAFAPLVVKDFKNNAVESLTLVNKTPAGDYETEVIGPEDVQYGAAEVIPEVDEEYPTTWPQRQAMIMQAMQMPSFQGAFSLIRNMDTAKNLLGQTDLVMPGEEAYARQWKQISELLAQQPVPGPMVPVLDQAGMPMVDPMTGQQQLQPGPMVSSIQPQPLDDNASMLQALQDYYYSEQGAADEKTNPMGFQNVMLLAQARQAAVAMQAPPMQG